MLRATLIFLATTIGLIATSVGWFAIKPGALKPLVVYLTERFTGYELAIDGSLETTFSLQPTLKATRLSLTNAPWAKDAHIAYVDALRIQLDLPALLDKNINLLELQITGARGSLEVTEDGRSNLDFLSEDEEDDSRETEERWRFVVQGLVLDTVRIDARFGEIPLITLEIEEIVEVTDPASHLVFTGYGELNDNEWRLQGDVGPIQAIFDMENVQADLALELDGLDIAVEGIIGSLSSLASLDLDYSMQGPDASIWGELLGLSQAFQGDVALEGRIEPAGTGLAVSIQGHVATYTVSVEGTVQDAISFDGIDIRFDLDGPDIGVLGLLFFVDGMPGGPFSAGGHWRSFGPDVEIRNLTLTTDFAELSGVADLNDFPSLQSGTAALSIHGNNSSAFRELFDMPYLIAEPFQLDLALDATDGQTDVEFSIGGNRLSANGVLGPYPDFQGSVLSVRLSGISFDDVLGSFGTQLGGASAYRANGTIALGNSELTLPDLTFSMGPISVQGSLLLPINPSKPIALQLEYQLASLAKIAEFTSTHLPDWPADGVLHLTRADGIYELVSGTMEANGLALTADGILGSARDSKVTLDISVSGPSANLLFPDYLQETQDYPFTLSGRLNSSGESVVIEDLIYRAEDAEIHARASLPLNGSIAGLRVGFKALGPSLQTLLPGDENYRPIDERYRIDGGLHFPSADLINLENIDLGIGGLDLILNGTVDLSDQIEVDLDVQMRGESMADIGYINERQLPDIPFELATSLRGNKSRIDIGALSTRWADSDFSGSGSIILEETPRLVLKGQSRKFDLQEVQEAIYEPIDVISPETAGNRVFPDTPLTLEYLHNFDADIDVLVREFRMRLMSFDEVSTSLVIQDGSVYVDEFEFRDKIGHFTGKGSLIANEDTFDFSLSVQGDDADLGLFTESDQPADTIPRYTLDIDLDSHGQSIGEIAGNLNGTLLVHSEGGQIDNDLIEVLGGDFLGNVMGTLLPIEQALPYTDMECLVFKGRVKKGALTFKPGFTIRTAKVNAFVLGTVDLQDEKLDLYFSTQARSGIGISASSILNPYFKVGGSLSEPKLELDTTSAAIAYSIAAGTGGLSILLQGFFDRLLGGQNPCKKYLAAEY